MREAIVYYAYDDTEFSDRESCLDYEKEAMELMKEINEKYSFFDENMGPFVAPLDSVDIEDWIDWLKGAAAAFTFIRRRDNLSTEADRFIFNNCGYCINNDDFGNEEENIGLFKLAIHGFEMYVKVGE